MTGNYISPIALNLITKFQFLLCDKKNCKFYQIDQVFTKKAQSDFCKIELLFMPLTIFQLDLNDKNKH